jgi:hypothetical protein
MNDPILDCGHPPSLHGKSTTGYGTTADGERHCWECCADADRKHMLEGEPITLYLTAKDGKAEVTNWPGSLRIRAVAKVKGRIFGHPRTDVWFTGPGGREWHGYGCFDNKQCFTARRVGG